MKKNVSSVFLLVFFLLNNLLFVYAEQTLKEIERRCVLDKDRYIDC